MLALTRRTDEAIIIDGNIEIKILEIQGDKVKIGIEAPKEIGIHRYEIYKQIEQNNKEAVKIADKNMEEMLRIKIK